MGICPGGVSVRGGVCRGVSAPVHAGIHTPPVDRILDIYMLMKILPFRNFVCGRQLSLFSLFFSLRAKISGALRVPQKMLSEKEPK